MCIRDRSSIILFKTEDLFSDKITKAARTVTFPSGPLYQLRKLLFALNGPSTQTRLFFYCISLSSCKPQGSKNGCRVRKCCASLSPRPAQVDHNRLGPGHRLDRVFDTLRPHAGGLHPEEGEVAVSYTHLDVYKRQDQDWDELIKKVARIVCSHEPKNLRKVGEL